MSEVILKVFLVLAILAINVLFMAGMVWLGANIVKGVFGL